MKRFLLFLIIFVCSGSLFAEWRTEQVTYWDPVSQEYVTDTAQSFGATESLGYDSGHKIFYCRPDTKWYGHAFDGGKMWVIRDGHIKLILGKGCDMDFPKGISIGNNGKLSIYSTEREVIPNSTDGNYNNSSAGRVHAHSSVGDDAGIELWGNAQLEINGGCVWAVSEDTDGAGIGSKENATGSTTFTVTINHGCVFADSAPDSSGRGGADDGCGAGIGLGHDFEGTGIPTININGGRVEAKSYGISAAIGGAEVSSSTRSNKDRRGCNINITGGRVIATVVSTSGSSGGAGIGGGRGSAAGIIKISGGYVEAHGSWNGDKGCGIGCGSDVSTHVTSDRNVIEISGGTVIAYGAAGAPGIGLGEDPDNGGDGMRMTVKITGGNVYAQGWGKAPGIGSNNGTDGKHGVDINITGGIVEAVRGSDAGDDIGWANCDILKTESADNTRAGGAIIKATSIANCSLGGLDALIIRRDNNEGQIYNYSTPGYFTLNLGAWDSEQERVYADLGNAVIYVPEDTEFRIPDGVGLKSGVINLIERCSSVNYYNAPAALSINGNDESVMVKRRLKVDWQKEHIKEPGLALQQDVTKRDIVVQIEASPGYNLPKAISVKISEQEVYALEAVPDEPELAAYSYRIARDENDRERYAIITLYNRALTGNVKIYAKGSWHGETLPDGTIPYVPGMNPLESDTYVITNTLTVSTPITIIGNVKILSCQDTVFTVNGGLQLDDMASLTIGGYNGGAGKIVANGESFTPGINVPTKASLTINDCEVVAQGDKYAAGIGSKQNVVSGKIYLNGGNISATGGQEAAGIGGGRNADFGPIYIRSASNDVVVSALGGIRAPGIGGGASNTSSASTGTHGALTIESGYVEAYGRSDYPGAATIGIGSSQWERTTVDFNTGTNGNGNAVIRTTYMSVEDNDKIKSKWNAVIFESENEGGRVYGTVVLQDDLKMEKGEILAIGEGSSLIVGMENNAKVQGEGTIDLSEGGTLVTRSNASIASGIKIIYPAVGDLITTKEKKIKLSEEAESELYRIWENIRSSSGVEVTDIEIYDSKTSEPSTTPVKAMNNLIVKWGKYFSDYIGVEQNGNKITIVEKKPEFSITGFSVRNDVVSFKIHVENAKFLEGTKIRLHASNDLKRITDIKDFYNPIAEFDIEGGTSDIEFSCELTDPENQKFFKAVLIPTIF